MAIEIELKAHVKDREALKATLDEKAKFCGSFVKEDCYWLATPDMPVSKLRFRREKLCLPDGSEKETYFTTCKIKELRDGIEINDEFEFEVNPGPAFEEFIKQLGFTPDISKRKQGWAYSWKGICAELAEVEGLGWFLELEILAEDKQEKTLLQARNRLLDLLNELGIDRQDIESRFYTEMLLSKP